MYTRTNFPAKSLEKNKKKTCDCEESIINIKEIFGQISKAFQKNLLNNFIYMFMVITFTLA